MKKPARTPKKISFKVWLPIVIAIVALGCAAAWFFVAAPYYNSQQHANQLHAKAKQLSADHQTCVDQLNKNYQKLDENNQESYQKAYDQCESIRKQQNETVDKYNSLTQE